MSGCIHRSWLPWVGLLAASVLCGQPVLDLGKSPYAKLHPVPVKAVRLHDGFWSERQRVNIERSLPSLLLLLEEHGIVDNFRGVSGRKQVTRRGPLYTDSDLYKWIEAAAFVLQAGERPELRTTVDKLVDEIGAAQEPSGYLNTYYQGERMKLRFTEMTRGHELYCLGHLLQAGIAYERATGDRKLLGIGIKFVEYLERDFGLGKRPLLTGHPELELALIELYRTTAEKRHLELAGYLLSGVERDRLKLTNSQVKYMFSGKPFTERTEFEGHAVRAMYAASGAADYYLETGDARYKQTLDRLWTDLTDRKMYITGGVGSRSDGEAFGAPYELPNMQAYTESCAAIGSMMFNFRMLALSADARYVDTMERALYNGINSGMSLTGNLYCYRNPLASAGHATPGDKIRNEWYDTTCCPPNLQRIFASLPGYFYATSADGLYVNFYDTSDLDWKLEDGTALKVAQKTRYPWEGEATLTVNPAAAKEFTLFLRIPAWSPRTAIAVNGTAVTGVKAAGYEAIRRTWKAGDRVTMRFDMQVRRTEANPRVAEDFGKVAIERGPLVYCVEDKDAFEESLSAAPFTAKYEADSLGGVVVLSHAGRVWESPSTTQPLYSRAAARPAKPKTLTLIPYFAWANRESMPMTVWLPQ